jgi:hypothetical protein
MKADGSAACTHTHHAKQKAWGSNLCMQATHAVMHHRKEQGTD